MARLLITGSSGYLGQHLLHELSRSLLPGGAESSETNHSITAAYGSLDTFEADATSLLPSVRLVKNLDLSSKDSIGTLLSVYGPFDLVIHLAAISSPGVCESDGAHARKVNTPIAFLDALPTTTNFVFLSTDQVYDGNKAPYLETDEAAPVNLYGQTKLSFEKELLTKRKMNAVALRSSLILGPAAPVGRCRKHTFLQFVQSRLKEGKATDFYTDEYRSVVFVGDVVRTILYFVVSGIEGKAGVYNMGGSDRVSRFDIAKAVADHCGLDSSCARGVERSSLPPGGVRSPLDIAMNSTKLETVTGIKMIGLDEIVRRSLPESGE